MANYWAAVLHGHAGLSRRAASRLGAAWALAAALLAACQAAGPQLPLLSPQEVAGEFGYADTQVGENRFEVNFLTPRRPTVFDEAGRQEDAQRTRLLARDFATWRAAHLSLSKGFPAFVVAESHTDVDFATYDQTYYPPYYAAPYPPFHPRFYDFHRCARYPWPYCDLPIDYRSSWLQARATLLIELRKEATETSLDAQEVVEEMRARYPTAYPSPAETPPQTGRGARP